MATFLQNSRSPEFEILLLLGGVWRQVLDRQVVSKVEIGACRAWGNSIMLTGPGET